MSNATRAVLDSINLSDRRLKLYDEKEACAILGISTVTLWRIRRAGRISYRRINHQLRYSEADLTEFLERQKRPAIAA